MSKAKSAAERGELNCKRLKNLVADEIQEAGGELDYAEVSLGWFKLGSVLTWAYIKRLMFCLT